jgi:hypothetical protein
MTEFNYELLDNPFQDIKYFFHKKTGFVRSFLAK